MTEETRQPTMLERVSTLEGRVDTLEAKLRSQGSRLAQFEDSVSFYGPPPRRRRLNIPELDSGQTRTLVLIAVLMTLAVLPVLITRSRRDYVSPV